MENELLEYHVKLYEDKEEVSSPILFVCMAEDEGHAREQAQNAYEMAEIIKVWASGKTQ